VARVITTMILIIIVLIVGEVRAVMRGYLVVTGCPLFVHFSLPFGGLSRLSCRGDQSDLLLHDAKRLLSCGLLLTQGLCDL